MPRLFLRKQSLTECVCNVIIAEDILRKVNSIL